MRLSEKTKTKLAPISAAFNAVNHTRWTLHFKVPDLTEEVETQASYYLEELGGDPESLKVERCGTTFLVTTGGELALQFARVGWREVRVAAIDIAAGEQPLPQEEFRPKPAEWDGSTVYCSLCGDEWPDTRAGWNSIRECTC